MSLNDDFAQAGLDVKKLDHRPSNEELLRLYAFYKQATEGNVSGEKPTGFDFKGIAKFEVWEELKGMTLEEAMTGYVQLVRKLQNK